MTQILFLIQKVGCFFHMRSTSHHLMYIALLPPPFLSHQRRNLIRPRSQTHAAMTQFRTPSSPTMTRSHRTPSSSPISSRRASSFAQSENVLTTPPPNRLLANQLKLKGSFTDPAQPRRREAFGVVRYQRWFADICLTVRFYRYVPHPKMSMSATQVIPMD